MQRIPNPPEMVDHFSLRFFFFFFPPSRSCHGSSRLAKGNGQDMCQSEQPAYYFKAFLPLRFCPPRQPPLDLELEDLDLRSSHTAC